MPCSIRDFKCSIVCLIARYFNTISSGSSASRIPKRIYSIPFSISHRPRYRMYATQFGCNEKNSQILMKTTFSVWKRYRLYLSKLCTQHHFVEDLEKNKVITETNSQSEELAICSLFCLYWISRKEKTEVTTSADVYSECNCPQRQFSFVVFFLHSR